MPKTALTAAVEVAARTLGFRPRLTVTGPVDLAVPEAIGADLLAVTGEALSNVVKYAHATSVGIDLVVSSDLLTLRVTDDGVGVDQRRSGNGVVNMRNRAEDRGGEFSLAPAEPRGTVLTWTVLLDS